MCFPELTYWSKNGLRNQENTHSNQNELQIELDFLKFGINLCIMQVLDASVELKLGKIESITDNHIEVEWYFEENILGEVWPET